MSKNKYQLLVDNGIKSVYIANKMRGLPNCGRDWFTETRGQLRALGIKVYCPVELDELFPCPYPDPESQEAWRHFMQRDLECILQAKPDAILLGPQWELSPGANIEASMSLVVDASLYWQSASGYIARCDHIKTETILKKRLPGSYLDGTPKPRRHEGTCPTNGLLGYPCGCAWQ